MADRDQFDTSKRGMDEKPQRDVTGKGGHTSGAHSRGAQGDLLKEREHGSKPGGTVGREVPDESKERHTEIAVEAGRKIGERHRNKR